MSAGGLATMKTVSMAACTYNSSCRLLVATGARLPRMFYSKAFTLLDNDILLRVLIYMM